MQRNTTNIIIIIINIWTIIIYICQLQGTQEILDSLITIIELFSDIIMFQ